MILIYYIISHRITSHHIISRHVASHHVTSFIILYYIISYHIISYYITLYHIIFLKLTNLFWVALEYHIKITHIYLFYIMYQYSGGPFNIKLSLYHNRDAHCLYNGKTVFWSYNLPMLTCVAEELPPVQRHTCLMWSLAAALKAHETISWTWTHCPW